jgi:hypothetical protein
MATGTPQRSFKKKTRKETGKLQRYLEKTKRKLTEDETESIRRRSERGDGNVYKLAKEFGCVPTQIAGVKARMKF